MQRPGGWPGLFGFAYCFNYMGWRETSMPTFEKNYVVWMVRVRGILGVRGA